jgi:hypothetical protein
MSYEMGVASSIRRAALAVTAVMLVVNAGKLFPRCVSGPAARWNNLCAAWNDLDGDGDVDLRDYAELQDRGPL